MCRIILKRRVKIILALIIVCLGISIFLGHKLINKSNYTSKSLSKSTLKLVDSKTTTMKEAINIAYKSARKWCKSAKLTFITSTDAISKSSTHSGSNGKRRVWNIFFTESAKNTTHKYHEYNIFVLDRRVIKENKASFAMDKPINTSNVKIDSSDALKIAIGEKKLKPGKDWAIGYHFTLSYQSFCSSSQKQKLVIEVIGLSPKGNFANIFVDPITGKIILAQEKTYDSKGNAIWTSF